MKKRAFFALLLLASLLAITHVADAQATYDILHAFSQPSVSGTNADGAEPQGGLVTGTDGYYYGVADAGGTHSAGAIFKVSPDGSVYQTLHSFDTIDANGINVEGADCPAPLLAGTDGFLYGVNEDAGANGQGTVFKIKEDGTGFAVIHTFTDVNDGSTTFPTNTDGANPHCSLIFGPGGLLYGTVRYGDSGGTGGIFKMSTDGATFDTLYNFTDITQTFSLENGYNNDGAFPQAGLLLARDGSLYGSTSGGGLNQSGDLFKIGTDGNNFTVLYTFTAVSSLVQGVNPDGGDVRAPLVQGSGTDNNFYGTTFGGGGNGLGTVFQLSANGVTLKTLHTFTPYGGTEFNSDGANPGAALVAGTDGNFYGTAVNGGANTYGTVYEISPGGAFNTIYSFQQGDGTNPLATLVSGSGGFFFGTTSSGGPNASSILGTVFKVRPAPIGSGTFDVTVSSLPSDGGDVQGGGSFVSGSSSTVSAAAADGFVFKNWLVNGAVVSTSTTYSFTVTADTALVANFEPTPGNFDFTVVHAFTPLDVNEANVDGASPPGLIKGADGYFYGATSNGGAYGSGAIFKMSGDGTIYTTLHSFDVIDANGLNVEGSDPAGPLVQGTDSYLYGVAFNGGANANGTIFKIGTDGNNFAVIHTFSEEDVNVDNISVNLDGANPLGGLVQGLDGDFYGTAEFGGTNGSGTLYKVSADGNTFVTLHPFETLTYIGATTGSNNEGAFPKTGLVMASDHSFYGSTTGGGLNQNGTIFRLAFTGTYATIYTFTAVDNGGINDDGASPVAPLIQGTDSMLYGTAPVGGANGAGTVFKLATNGTGYSEVYTFSQLGQTGYNSDGATSKSPVYFGSDGKLYGAATEGGPNGFGTIFQLTTSGSFNLIYSPTEFEGVSILGSLLDGGDGYIYGAASSGGQNGDTQDLGTVFRIASVITQTGSVKVTILPAAVTGSAQWQVDGSGAYVSGTTVTGLSTGSHTINFSLVSGYTKPADQVINVAANQTTSLTGTYVATTPTTGSLQVTILPAGAVTAGAKWQVDGGALEASGTTVTGLSTGSHTVTFSTVSGFITPGSQNINVVANQTATTTGTYVASAQTGSLQVTITPAGAVTAGATWQVDGGSAEVSGSAVTGLATRQSHGNLLHRQRLHDPRIAKRHHRRESDSDDDRHLRRDRADWLIASHHHSRRGGHCRRHLASRWRQRRGQRLDSLRPLHRQPHGDIRHRQRLHHARLAEYYHRRESNRDDDRHLCRHRADRLIASHDHSRRRRHCRCHLASGWRWRGGQRLHSHRPLHRQPHGDLRHRQRLHHTGLAEYHHRRKSDSDGNRHLHGDCGHAIRRQLLWPAAGWQRLLQGYPDLERQVHRHGDLRRGQAILQGPVQPHRRFPGYHDREDERLPD